MSIQPEYFGINKDIIITDVMDVEEIAAEIGEGEIVNDVWNLNIPVSEGSILPSEAQVIADCRQERYNFPEDIFEEVYDNWGHTSYHAPAAFVEGIEELHNQFDIVKYALGENDIYLMPEEDKSMVDTVDETIPKVSTSDFIHKSNDSYPLTLLTSKKRKVGRPARASPREITEVSKDLPPEEFDKRRYRRMRDLNNEASKKCRQKRKAKFLAIEEECFVEENRHLMLKQKIEQMEAQVNLWKKKCETLGLQIKVG